MFFSLSLVSMSRSVVDFELRQILNFHGHAEARFGEQVENMRQANESRPPAYWAEALGGYSRGELADDEYVELCDLSRLNNYFGIVITYSVFERFLLDVVGSAKIEIESDPDYKEEKMDLRKYSEFLERLGIDLKSDQFEYAQLMEFNRRRNLIMHRGGWIQGCRRGDTFVSEQQLLVTDAYFYDCVGLVGVTCQLIAQKYEEQASLSERREQGAEQ